MADQVRASPSAPATDDGESPRGRGRPSDKRAYRRKAPSGAPSLHHLLSRSPLSRLAFEHGHIAGPVREVDV